MTRSGAPLAPGDRVLVTGHRGLVGRAVTARLTAARLEVAGLDLADGLDVTDPAAVGERIRACAGVVHLAAVDDEADPDDELAPGTTGGTAQVMEVGVGGTAVVLAAAARSAVRRIVLMSSVDVLGCFGGAAPPRAFPIDDDHPVAPVGAYGWAKLAAEELCAATTRATGVPTVCLRPPGVVDERLRGVITDMRRAEPSAEWSPIWEYGAFIDVLDLADAVLAALSAEGVAGHHRLLVHGPDISSAEEGATALAARLLPGVPVRDPARWAADPFAPLVDASGAAALLAWRPTRPWRRGAGGSADHPGAPRAG